MNKKLAPYRLYLKILYHQVFYVFVVRPMLRLFAFSQNQYFRSIGRTKIIGDASFVSLCEEFSQRLQKEDFAMYENIFIKNKFIFTQYSDYKFKNTMFGEYAIPLRYQKLKVNGIGAMMIYGFYSTEFYGRTIRSQVHQMSQPGFSRIPLEKAYLWLTKHQFPDAIIKWYEESLGPSSSKITDSNPTRLA